MYKRQQLGLDEEGNYDSDKGVETLAKYTEMFGLGETTGLEIPESEPQISDEYSVQSAIGQGTNNFTVSQLKMCIRDRSMGLISVHTRSKYLI